jgi:pre-mRNA-processing factor SLU7
MFNSSDIKADDVVVNFDNLTYDEKRDRWNGYDPESYKDVILEHQLYEEKRKEIRDKMLGEKAVDDEFRTTE